MSAKKPKARNGIVLPARMRHAGPMKDRRLKRGKEQKDWTKEEESGPFVCLCGHTEEKFTWTCPKCGLTIDDGPFDDES